MSLNVGKVTSNYSVNYVKASANPFAVKNTFEFGNAKPDRPESRSWFTQEQLCGAKIDGEKLYILG